MDGEKGGPNKQPKVFCCCFIKLPGWMGVCVCVCVCVRVRVSVYFEIKSTWQRRRSSSEPWRKVAKVFFCFFILLPGWVGVLVGG